MAKKAEKKIVDEINAAKPNNEDVEEAKVLIDKLNERVKHVSVLLGEIANSLNPIR